MSDLALTFAIGSLPTILALIGIAINNRRGDQLDANITKMQVHMDLQFDAMERRFDSLFREKRP